MTTQGFNDTDAAVIQLITDEDALRNGGWTAALHVFVGLTTTYSYRIAQHGNLRASVGSFSDEESATRACMVHAVRVASRG